MKVVLMDNIPNLGQKFDIKSVKPGYWRNFLLPRGLAVMATPPVLKQMESRRAAYLEQLRAQEEKFLKDLEAIAEKGILIEVKADEKGNLFAGVDEKAITRAIEKNGLSIPSGLINLKKPIKKIGSYEIPVKEKILKVEIVQESEKVLEKAEEKDPEAKKTRKAAAKKK